MAKRSGAWALARLAVQSLLVGGFFVLVALLLKLVQEIICTITATVLCRAKNSLRRNINTSSERVHHENVNEGKV